MADSPVGLTLPRVEKQGDISRVSQAVQRAHFQRLYDIRRLVQQQRKLDWVEFWTMDAQKECQTALRKEHDDNLSDERAGANRKAKDSWYNTWCYQTYGGQGWVKVFFAFGSVDERMVQIFNEEWAEKIQSLGYEPQFEPRNPRISARNLAIAAGEKVPEVPLGPATHKSDRKKLQEDLMMILGEFVSNVITEVMRRLSSVVTSIVLQGYINIP